jgi:hypothetical protein
MSDFNFIDKSKVLISEFKYHDFTNIIKKFGYSEEKNGFLHTYFDWNKLVHWAFDFEVFDETELTELFKSSVVYRENVSFLIRLSHEQNLIQVQSVNLASMLYDLSYETGMGWEAISINGKYIIELTDGYQHKAISNFEI